MNKIILVFIMLLGFGSLSYSKDSEAIVMIECKKVWTNSGSGTIFKPQHIDCEVQGGGGGGGGSTSQDPTSGSGSGSGSGGNTNTSSQSEQEKKKKCDDGKRTAEVKYSRCKVTQLEVYTKNIQIFCNGLLETTAGGSGKGINGGVSTNRYQQCKDLYESHRNTKLAACELDKNTEIADACNG